MHVTRVRFGGFPPFNEAIELELDKQVNLFIGPNGVGKSSLLRRLDLSLTNLTLSHVSATRAKAEWDGDKTLSLSDDWMRLVQSHNASPSVADSSRESVEAIMRNMKAYPPTISIPATSVGHPGLSPHLFRPNNPNPSNIVGLFGTLSIDKHLDSIDVQYSLDNIRDDIERLARSKEDDCVDIPVSGEENDLMEKISVDEQASGQSDERYQYFL